MAASQAAPGPAAADPVVCACFGLGWRLDELLCRVEVPDRPPGPYEQASLPGMSKLASYDRQRLGLDQVDFVLGQVTTRAGAPAAVPLNLTADARGKLAAAAQGGGGTAARREAYRDALVQLHVDLLVTLTAADFSYGTAYGLGRALADTTRPHQQPGQLAASFERHRLGQLYAWLDELASRFPGHAARSVEQSLRWWERAVAAPTAGTAQAADARVLAGAAAHQGEIWRSVLTGEKLCTDLLTPEDYVRAGERLAHRYTGLVRRAGRHLLPWLVPLVLLLAAVVLVLIFVPGSPVARTATAVAASAGTLSGIWKMIRARVAPIAAQLEQPLWGTELNTATAEAITVPPVATSGS